MLSSSHMNTVIITHWCNDGDLYCSIKKKNLRWKYQFSSLDVSISMNIIKFVECNRIRFTRNDQFWRVHSILLTTRVKVRVGLLVTVCCCLYFFIRLIGCFLIDLHLWNAWCCCYYFCCYCFCQLIRQDILIYAYNQLTMIRNRINQ